MLEPLSDNDILGSRATKRQRSLQTPSHIAYFNLCEKGSTMESATTGNLGKSSRELADKAADKAKAGIRHAKESVEGAGDKVSSEVSTAHDSALPLVRNASGRAQSAAQQSFDSLSDMADKAREMVSGAADSVVSYTKKNPLQALAIAAASGALIYAALKAFRTYRD